jgi:adenosylmethionine-8-amino-7-oxononanoate aminotransferase
VSDGRTLVARDTAHVWHPYTQMQTRPDPIPIVRGEGAYLYTADGRRLLDATSSWWVNIHGHAHPRLNQALAAQAGVLEHVQFANCTHEPAVALAERLVAVAPRGLTRVFYSDNGSTAVEVALKLACQYWRNRGEPSRHRIIGLRHAYHGDTVGAMSASEASVFTQPFVPFLFDIERAHAPYCFRCPVGLDRSRCRIDCLGDLDDRLRLAADSVAAVIVEPMLQGAGGMIVWPREFLAGVRQLCDRYGVLLIADEVLTGFGRTGRMFACEHANVTPDILCLSKALTAGYMPMAATLTTDAVYEAFLSDDRTRTFFHGHSFTANPLACAVALASLDIFRDEQTMRRVMEIEAAIARGLGPFRGLDRVGDVRSIGGVGVIELVGDSRAGTSAAGGGYLDSIGPRLTAALLEHGMLLRPLGNVVYFMPPYVVSSDEVAWALGTLFSVLRDLSTPGRHAAP